MFLVLIWHNPLLHVFIHQSSKQQPKGVHCTANNAVAFLVTIRVHACLHFEVFSVSTHKNGTTPYTQYCVMFICNCDSSQYPKIDVCQVHFSVSFLQGELEVNCSLSIYKDNPISQKINL